MPSFFNQSKKQNTHLSTLASMMYIIGAAYAESSPGQPSEASSPMLFQPQNQTAPFNAPTSHPQGKRDDSISTIIILATPVIVTLALILYMVIQAKRNLVAQPLPDLELQVRAGAIDEKASSSAP
ncbi:MAG: hypothetical protein ACYC0J_01315 [Gammaproteobacteria bacterium]